MEQGVTVLPDDLIRPSAAAKILGCHLATVCRWVLTGKLRGWRRGGIRYLVSRADVAAMIQPVEPVGQIPITPPPRARRMAAERAERELREAGYIR